MWFVTPRLHCTYYHLLLLFYHFFTFTFQVTALGDFSFTLQFGSNATSGQTGGTFEINVVGKGHPGVCFEKAYPTSGSYEPYANGVDQGTTEIRLVTGGFASGGTNFPNSEPSPDGQYIAYSYMPSGSPVDRHLFVVSATGGTPVQVTPAAPTSPRQNIGFVWGQNSAGDQPLCVMSDHESSANDKRIYTCVISGSGTPTVNNFTEITGWGTISSTRKPFTAKWSPDGTRLVFQLYTPVTGSPQRELWGCVFSGGTPSTATELKGTSSFTNPEVQIGGGSNDYVWADSSTLLYSADGDTAGVEDLYAVSVSVSGGVLVAGAQMKQNTSAPVSGYGSRWAVTSDGQRVAFIPNTSGIDVPLIANINTSSTPTNVSAVSGLTPQTNADCNRLVWAPDNLSLAFVGDLEVDSDFELYWQALTSTTGTVTLSGGTTRLSNTPTNYAVQEMHFSPDGGRILFRQYDFNVTSYNELVIATVSSTPTRVTIASGFTNPTASLNRPRWKPGTGDFVLVQGSISGSYEAWVIPLGGADLMTVGTRYTVSGSFSSGSIGSVNWVP